MCLGFANNTPFYKSTLGFWYLCGSLKKKKNPALDNEGKLYQVNALCNSSHSKPVMVLH